ncbi:hypothetical protein [Rhodohalobacter sp.]|uniref:hypothetical protein n=1 Tax=Rhodohalobacter sp. TaxID=1974210 RepID=UPI0035682713
MKVFKVSSLSRYLQQSTNHFFDAFPVDLDEAEGKKQLHSFKKVIKTGEPDKTGVLKVTEGDAHNKFNDTKFYELQNIPIKNDNDDVEFVIHTIRDITEEKRKKPCLLKFITA